jgi:hypothetical protein
MLNDREHGEHGEKLRKLFNENGLDGRIVETVITPGHKKENLSALCVLCGEQT